MKRKCAEEYSTGKKGLQSLRNDDDLSPNDRYRTILLDRTPKRHFPSFCSILDKRHLSRPQKGRADVQKITQLETKGLQSLKIDDDNSPNDRYGNILLRRVSIFNCLQVDFRVSV